MDVAWAAVALGAAAGAAGCLGVPRLIRSVPEPPAPPQTDDPPKEPYAAIAARPGLAGRSAAVGAIAGALVGWGLGWVGELALLLPLVPLGVALSVIDWRTRLLPTRMVIPATMLALAVAGLLALGRHDATDLVRALVGLVLARIAFWLLWFLRSAGMGFGDVRLSALLGFVLAFLGWWPWVVGLYAAFLLFGVPGLVLAVARRDPSILKSAHPFGPFLFAGALVGAVWGGPLGRSLAGG